MWFSWMTHDVSLVSTAWPTIDELRELVCNEAPDYRFDVVHDVIEIVPGPKLAGCAARRGTPSAAILAIAAQHCATRIR